MATGIPTQIIEDSAKAEWESLPLRPAAAMFGINTGNQVLKGDGFHISYNPRTDQGEETALCKNGKYLILLGDYREAYERLVPEGYAACLDYFRTHNGKHSPWSDA